MPTINLQIELENLSSPIDMHTYAGSTFDHWMTLTVWTQDQYMPSNCHALNLLLKTFFLLQCVHADGHTKSPTSLISLLMAWLLPASVITWNS